MKEHPMKDTTAGSLVDVLRQQREEALQASKTAGHTDGVEWASNPEQADSEVVRWFVMKTMRYYKGDWRHAIENGPGDFLIKQFGEGVERDKRIEPAWYWEGFAEGVVEVWNQAYGQLPHKN
jgi:hypothetical protein